MKQISILNLGKLIFGCLLMTFAVLPIHAQTGGTYTVTQSVIAGGGQQSANENYTVTGTIGQPLAGTLSSGATYSLRGGFWAIPLSGPTAASASISGQIRTADGRGIRNVRLVLTDASTGEARHAISSSFGYYRFEEITVGQTYILTVSAKRFSFIPNTRVITLLDDLNDEDFDALPLK